MMLIELFAPRGVLDDAQRKRLSEQLATEVMAADGIPDEVMERGRAMAWLLVHEPELWTIGGQPTDLLGGPRYVVRVSVPGGHITDGMRGELIERITRVLAEDSDDPQRLYDEPYAWVHVIELPDGNAGAFGQIMRTSDIMQLIVKGVKPGGDDQAVEQAAATVVDPICGMTVALTADAITLEHEGVTYGFCSPICRDMFADQQRSATAA